jgi:large subunit ribosomal protein L25
MTVKLPVKKREGKAKKQHSIDVISAVIYGPKQAPVAIEVGRKEFEKLFKTAGESTVIELTGLESTISTLVKEVTFAPLKGGVIHIDFYAIEKGKAVETHVPLHFLGEAPVLKSGAMINKVLHEVMVSCQPADLPAYLEVDLTKLVTTEDKIIVADIKLPKGVTVEEDPEDIVALAESIKEEPVAEPTIDIADIPVEAKGKTEETE